jgi:hypothetical protein
LQVQDSPTEEFVLNMQIWDGFKMKSVGMLNSDAAAYCNSHLLLLIGSC